MRCLTWMCTLCNSARRCHLFESINSIAILKKREKCMSMRKIANSHCSTPLTASNVYIKCIFAISQLGWWEVVDQNFDKFSWEGCEDFRPDTCRLSLKLGRPSCGHIRLLSLGPREPQYILKRQRALSQEILARRASIFQKFTKNRGFVPWHHLYTTVLSRWPEEAVTLITKWTQSLVPVWYGESTEATRPPEEFQLSRLVEERVNCLNDLPSSRVSLERLLDLHHTREEQWSWSETPR